MPNYYLLSLANRTNLDLCIKYALAGFTNSINGLWTYVEIDEGDFVSFLYAAHVWNLYRVKHKEALMGARELPPWPLVTFQKSGKTYDFPFRLHLEPVRLLHESLVRHEFAYVAENLLLRGGYGKTHFQADRTTLHNVSQMGELHTTLVEHFTLQATSFLPKFTFKKALVNPPATFLFSELILQALIKRYLREQHNLEAFLADLGLPALSHQALEVLGERALAEGHVDILVKDAAPMGVSSSVAIEVKLRSLSPEHCQQLAHYVEAMNGECRAGALIVGKIPSRAAEAATVLGLHPLTYHFDGLAEAASYSYSELATALRLSAP